MLGSRFIPYLKPTSPRPMIRLHNYIDAMDRRLTSLVDKAIKPLDLSIGTRLILDILENMDLDRLLYASDPLREILQSLPNLEQRIDPRLFKNTEAPLFLSVRHPCFEMITPARCLEKARSLSLDKPYMDNSWQSVRPFRVYDMGACDLTQQFSGGYLRFTKHSPTHAIYTLDIPLLVLKALSYLKTTGRVGDTRSNLTYFVLAHVVIPSLLQDSTMLWLRNVYRQQLIQDSPLETYTATMWDGMNFDPLGSDFRNAMIDVVHLRHDLQNKVIGPQTVLSSLYVTGPNKTLGGTFLDLYTTASLPDSQPYTWVTGLKNVAWWEIIILISSYVSDIPDVISFQRNVARDIRILLGTKPWNEIRASVAYTAMTSQRVEGLMRYLP